MKLFVSLRSLSKKLLHRAAVKPTLALLRGRLVARLDLALQLATLSKTKSTDTLLPPKLAGVYPARVVSKLKVWASVDWETYSAATATRHLTRDGVVDENDFLYKATCMRDKATMVAYVAVRHLLIIVLAETDRLISGETLVPHNGSHILHLTDRADPPIS